MYWLYPKLKPNQKLNDTIFHMQTGPRALTESTPELWQRNKSLILASLTTTIC